MIRIISVDVSGFAEVNRFIERFRYSLEKGKTEANKRAVRGVAKVWQRNFDSEGRGVGGWAALKQSTLDDRARHGFAPGPILRRSDALREVAVIWPQNLKGSGSIVRTDSYRGNPVWGDYAQSDGSSRLHMKGAKVFNQTGTVHMKARPFWFVDNMVLRSAKDGVVDWVVDEVKQLGGY